MTGPAVYALSISLDGYAAGPDQDEQNPLGVGGEQLHEWLFAENRSPVDDRFRARGQEGIGATIMGRNMFGPVRGPWSSAPEWRGWWGEDPPFHHDVFVLTHHPRPPLEMTGGTTFHFVTEGPDVALEQARAAAGGARVRVGGGAATVAQYARAGLLEEVHVAVVPVLLGAGERLFGNGVFPAAAWRTVEVAPSPAVTHVVLRRTGG
ncbi:dihydrofolate reductase family protein [Geodermatophilus sp. SYSU D00710]